MYNNIDSSKHAAATFCGCKESAELTYDKRFAKDSRALDRFEADLAILFGARFANPDYAATDGVQFIVARDDFDELATFKPKAAPETESLWRPVDDEARDALWLRAEVDDHARSLSGGNSLGAAAFVHGKCRHGFFLEGGFPHYTYYGASAITGRHRVNTWLLRLELTYKIGRRLESITGSGMFLLDAEQDAVVKRGATSNLGRR